LHHSVALVFWNDVHLCEDFFGIKRFLVFGHCNFVENFVKMWCFIWSN
jgi:hypothetical protein